MTAIRRIVVALLLVITASLAAAVAPRAAAAQAIVIRDIGPGRAGRWLRSALAEPHIIIQSDSAHPVHLARDTTYEQNVIVVGGPAFVASTVRGTVIVVGGDLFLHPGVNISSRAMAVGGGVYETTLGNVRGGTFSFREFTYRLDHRPNGEIALDYQTLETRDTRVVTLPGFYGVRIPSYDRTNGLSLPLGPTLSFDTARYELDLLAVYRSQLGAVDPEAQLRGTIGRRLTIQLDAGRYTETNDRWIFGDIPNSLHVLWSGSDTRNYYRADRADAAVSYLIETTTAEFTVHAGARAERARSVRPDTGARGGPWTLLERGEPLGRLRPNPRILPGTITSALGGVGMQWANQGVTANITTDVELPFATPNSSRFVQTTLDAFVGFPTFRTQTIEIESHALITAGDTAPPQRYSYLGGAGTLPTFELLQFGGDELFFAEGRYLIPIDRITIRGLGSPTVTLRYITGGAGVGTLPTLEQNVGLRFALSFGRVDYVVDPASRKSEFSFGISVFR
ncbi:MAG: hypothetical protein ACJ79K_01275 [Gemmatimonadaceae bacterium]